MNTEEMEARIQTPESQVRTLQTLLDIEEIKKLQRIHGFYLEHLMFFVWQFGHFMRNVPPTPN